MSRHRRKIDQLNPAAEEQWQTTKTMNNEKYVKTSIKSWINNAHTKYFTKTQEQKKAPNQAPGQKKKDKTKQNEQLQRRIHLSFRFFFQFT